MRRFALQVFVLGWFFFIMDANGNPFFNLKEFHSLADCQDARTWALTAHNKGVPMTDQVAAASYASPCYQAYTVMQ